MRQLIEMSYVQPKSHLRTNLSPVLVMPSSQPHAERDFGGLELWSFAAKVIVRALRVLFDVFKVSKILVAERKGIAFASHSGGWCDVIL